MTAPMTPIDCDLKSLRFMPLEIERLFRSKAWLRAKRKPALGFYMMNLWARSWHEVPAASLEDDDDVLADAAMCPPKEWPNVKAAALHGWVKCEDGRLYHPVVAEKALESWQQMTEFNRRRANFKSLQSEKGQKSAEARRLKTNGNFQPDEHREPTEHKPNGNRSATGDQPMKGNGKVIASSSAAEHYDPRARLALVWNMLGLSPATDAALLRDWPEQLAKLLAEGLDFEKHILPAVAEAQARGTAVKTMIYFRSRARELKAVGSIPIKIEPCTRSQWARRMQLYRHGEPDHGDGIGAQEPGMWSPLWGPPPTDPTCLCPPDLIQEAQA